MTAHVRIEAPDRRLGGLLEVSRIVQDEMQRLAEKRTTARVFVPLDDAEQLVLALERQGVAFTLRRPQP